MQQCSVSTTLAALDDRATVSGRSMDDSNSGLVPVSEAGGALQAPHFDTMGLSSDEAYESWRGMQAGVYEIAAPDPKAGASISLASDLWYLESLLVTRITLEAPFSVARTAQRVRSDHLDHYALMIRLAGNSLVESDGERRIVTPGQPFFADMAEPMKATVEAGSYLSVFIPREVLDEALPRPFGLHGVGLRGGAGSLLAAHVAVLAQHLPQIEASQAADITKATIALIAAALAPTVQTCGRARPVIEANVLRQISRYVELHLTDPELSPLSICKVFGLSRPTLYRLFEPFGGVASFVRERRLIAVRDKLQSATHRMPLHALAEAYAFSHAAHLSTSYRKMFGHSPSETQAAGGGSSALAAPRAGSTGSLFAQRLKSLRG
jgi:AraC-like DNA-binding protein